jgi:PAS domain S-box-containing protein
VNDSFTGLWGYDKEEVLGRHYRQLVRRSGQVEAVTEALVKKGSWQGELVATRKDGSTFDVQLSASMVRDKAGTPICMMSSFINISERKLAEGALQESEQKFRVLTEQSPNMIFINHRGRVVYANKKCEEVMGYTTEEFCSPDFDFLTLIAPESQELVKENLSRHMRGEEVPPFEYALLTKDGERIEALLATNLIQYGGETRILGTVTDITERKQANEELHKSEYKYRTLVENLPQRIFLKDRNSIYVSCNTNFARDLKMHPDEIAGKTDYEFFPKPLAEQYMADDSKIIESGRTAETEETYEVNGQELSVHILKTPVKDENGNITGILCILWDITERKRMEQQLKDYSDNLEQTVAERTRELRSAQEELADSEEKYRSIFEHAGDAIVVFNSKGVIQDLNHRAQQMLGYEAEEVLGRHWETLMPPAESAVAREGRREAERLVAQSIRQGSYRSHEMVSYINKGGGPLQVEATGAVIRDQRGKLTGFVSIFRDISDRRRLEKELADSEQRYRAIFDHAGDAIVVYDMNWAIAGWNQQAEEMFGYKAEEVLGRPALDIALPTTPVERRNYEEAIEQLVLEATKQGSYRSKEVITYMCKNGTPLPTETSGALVKDAQGNPTGFSAIYRDISDRKRLEEDKEQYARAIEAKIDEVERTKSELERAQDKLIRSEKLAGIGQLAGGVGHELRNPLGAIRNAAYLLNMILTEPEPAVKEALAILQKEVTRSDHIITDLLDFSRPGKPNIATVDINKLVQLVLQATASPKNVELSSSLGQDLAPMMADAGQLEQILSNLVTNAIQAMPDGGRLSVSTSGKDDLVEVMVTDTGIGIPEENLDKVFEPLFTTKTKGVGLGLALSKALVERQCGTLEVDSEVGKGSTFTLTLPVSGKE